MADRIEVPAREGQAVRVPAGARFRIVDLEGKQVVDTFAYCADDLSEYASAEHTRVHVGRLFPRPGEHFVTNRRRPILLLVEDTSPGVHDMLCAACDPARYEGLGARGWHASCRENVERAMAAHGHERVTVPQPINLFMNAPVGAGGELRLEPAPTRPGDYVMMRAELDLWLAVSACPQDLVPINDGRPTPIAVELLAP